MQVESEAKRLQSTLIKGRRAIFYLGGKFRTCDAEADRTEIMLLDYQDRCMGYYDRRVTPEELLEDIEDMLQGVT